MNQILQHLFQITDEHKTIWSIRERDLPPRKRLILRFYKIFHIAAHSPFNSRILSHASALSFTLLLSLIPMLAMIFSIAKGFGIQEKIEPLLLEKALGGEIGADLIPKIIEYVDNTNVAALGSIGLLFIVYILAALLGQIEDSFNRIWSVKKSRTMIRKASDYLSILVISPLLLAITVGFLTTLMSHSLLQRLLGIGLFAGAMKLFLLSLPWVSSIMVLTLLYMIIPNTNVRLVPALLAGTIAGILWQLSQLLFINFQIGVARYNAIYGTFASVPIFMIWLQVSWIIVLFGGVINFACQNAGKFHPLEFAVHIPFGAKEKICLAVLITICRKFGRGEGPSSPEEISEQLGVSENFVRNGLNRLLSIGKILPVNDESREFFLPAKPIAELKIADFFADVKGAQADKLQFRDQEINATVRDILVQRRRALEVHFDNRGMTSLKGETR